MPATRWIKNDPTFNFFSPFVFPFAVWVFLARANLAPFRRLKPQQRWISALGFAILFIIMLLVIQETLRREPLEPFHFRDTASALASEEGHRATVRELDRRSDPTDALKEQLKALKRQALEDYKSAFPGFGSLPALWERGSSCAWVAFGVNAASAFFVFVFFWYLWNTVLFHRVFSLQHAEWIVLVAGLLVVWLPLRFYTEWYLGFYSMGTLDDRFRLIKFIFVVAILVYGLFAFTLAKKITVKAFSMVGVGLLTLLLVLVSTGCSCVSYSVHGFVGPSPPPLMAAAGVLPALRQAVNRSIGGVARSLGCVTVGFKRVGIFGWNDMRFAVDVEGRVRQAAYSTDRYLTLDLELDGLVVDGVEQALDGPRFLRAEICTRALQVERDPQHWLSAKVRVRGRLMWDRDGFLEVHPQTAADVARIPP